MIKIDDQLEKQKLEDFCKEVNEVCCKYGYSIDGCGCCGSPYIVNTKTDRILADYVWLGEDSTMDFLEY